MFSPFSQPIVSSHPLLTSSKISDEIYPHTFSIRLSVIHCIFYLLHLPPFTYPSGLWFMFHFKFVFLIITFCLRWLFFFFPFLMLPYYSNQTISSFLFFSIHDQFIIKDMLPSRADRSLLFGYFLQNDLKELKFNIKLTIFTKKRQNKTKNPTNSFVKMVKTKRENYEHLPWSLRLFYEIFMSLTWHNNPPKYLSIPCVCGVESLLSHYPCSHLLCCHIKMVKQA